MPGESGGSTGSNLSGASPARDQRALHTEVRPKRVRKRFLPLPRPLRDAISLYFSFQALFFHCLLASDALRGSFGLGARSSTHFKEVFLTSRPCRGPQRRESMGLLRKRRTSMLGLLQQELAEPLQNGKRNKVPDSWLPPGDAATGRKMLN